MNSAQPQVTVVIPTFNRVQVLKRAVDSVLDQDYENFELVVVDDGSTDETCRMLGEYGDRLRIISRENGGVSAARNTAIREAAGDFVALLDSDDEWLPGKLTAQVAYFRENPDAVICQTEEIWIRKGVRVNPKIKHKKPSGMIFMPSLHLCLVSPSAVMIRRNIFEEVGLFDETFPACEDYDLWLRIALKYPVGLIDTPYIRKHGGHDDQLSSEPGLDKYRILSLEKIIATENMTDDQRAAAAEVLIRKSEIYAGGCLKRGRNEEADYFTEIAERHRNLTSL